MARREPQGARYFVRDGTRLTGPFTVAELVELQRKGKLARFVRLSTDRVHWVGPASIPELARPARTAREGPVQTQRESQVQGETQAPIQMPFVEQAAQEVVIDPTWYYAIEGETLGPTTVDQLRQLLAEGHMTPDTLVWHANLGDWQPAYQVAELAEAPAVDPAEAFSYVSDADQAPAASSGNGPVMGLAIGLAALIFIILGVLGVYLLQRHNSGGQDEPPAAAGEGGDATEK
jgi:hypothetical protein